MSEKRGEKGREDM